MNLLKVKKMLLLAVFASLSAGLLIAADDAPAKAGKDDNKQAAQRPNRGDRFNQNPKTPLGQLMVKVNELIETKKTEGARLELAEDIEFYKSIQGKSVEQMAVDIQNYIKKQKEKSEQLAAILLAQAADMINKSELTDEQKATAFAQTFGNIYNGMNEKTTYIQIKMADFLKTLNGMDRDTRREAMQGFFEEVNERGALNQLGGGFMRQMFGRGAPRDARPPRDDAQGQDNNNKKPEAQKADREMF